MATLPPMSANDLNGKGDPRKSRGGGLTRGSGKAARINMDERDADVGHVKHPTYISIKARIMAQSNLCTSCGRPIEFSMDGGMRCICSKSTTNLGNEDEL